jgi:K+-transporting ATPase A subunit
MAVQPAPRVFDKLRRGGLLLCGWAEQKGNPNLARLGLSPRQSAIQSGGNMERKEVRFGITQSAVTGVVTSDAATGSYNSMDDSYTPLGGAVLLVNMLLGEIVFGGLGTGLYSIILIALIGLLLAGLIVGRTPEYLGRKIRPPEAKMIAIFAVFTHVAILPLTAVAVVTKAGLAGLTTNTGAHGFTEILFAYASCLANNGQNFSGLNANTTFYNVTTSIAMMIGRFGLAIPALRLNSGRRLYWTASAHLRRVAAGCANRSVSTRHCVIPGNSSCVDPSRWRFGCRVDYLAIARNAVVHALQRHRRRVAYSLRSEGGL